MPDTPVVHTSLEEMLKRILNSRVYEVARKTPLDAAHRLSRRLHNQVVLKREDLSGMDAARKGLILARLLGYRGPAPTPQSLVPKALQNVSLDEFFARLPQFDKDWADRAAREQRAGKVLRYVVAATPRSVSASLVAVPASSPMGSLEGTRNLISFTTRRYSREPLVVSGPGAGPAVTAAGILNDIYSLAER